jgi:uncharacterized protein (TIGR03083 family)
VATQVGDPSNDTVTTAGGGGQAPPYRQKAGRVDYATALTGQNQMLGELLRDAGWSVPVPTCPGWTLLQLLRHVGRGDRWAAQIIADRADTSLDPRLVRDGKPPADVPGAIRWLSQSPQVLLAAVEAIGPGSEVSTFVGPRPAAWWTRRRLHEATVHRADAAIALGAPYELSAELAADGISEWLERLADEQALGKPPSLPAGTSLTLRATDRHLADSAWTVFGGATGVHWVARPGIADLTVSGPTTDLLLALLRRHPAEATGISMQGDTALWRSWLALTPL